MAHAFTPRALARLTASVERIAGELLDALRDRPSFDLVESFASPLPLYIICEILGLPPEDRALFRAGAAAVVAGLEPGAPKATLEAADQAVIALAEVVERHLAAREAAGGQDDLLALLLGLPERERLSRDELIHQAIFLLNAGHETTTGAIANGAAALIAEPEARAVEPDGYATAADEILRLYPPLHFTFRRTVAPVRVEGIEIPAETTLLILLAAANRDPRVFPDPDRFEPLRGNARRHLSFAAGRHTCLGAALARIEIALSLKLLFEIMPDLRLTGPAVPSGGFIFQGIRRLPVIRSGR